MSAVASSRLAAGRSEFDNASWIVGERVVTLASTLIINIVLARALGPFAFGSLSFVLAAGMLLAPVLTFGINAIVTREWHASGETERPRIVPTTITVRAIGAAAVVAAGASLLFVLGFPADAGERVGITIFMICAITSALHVIDFIFQGERMGYVVARGRLLVLLASAAIKLVVATQSSDVLVFAILFAFDQVLLSVMFYLLYRRRFGRVQWRQASPAYGLKLLRQSSWLVMSALAATLNLKVGQLMLGELVSRQATGIYAVASRLSEVWYFLPDALMAAFFPRMLDLRKSSASDYQVLMQRLCDALFVGSTLLAGVVTLAAAPVIELLYGAAYAESAAVLSIHVWAGVFVFMRALFSRWLIAEGLLKYSLMSHGAGALVNVALNFLLIPSHGPIGAAISALLAYLVSSYLCLMLFSRTRPMAGIMTRSLLLIPTAGYRYWR